MYVEEILAKKQWNELNKKTRDHKTGIRVGNSKYSNNMGYVYNDFGILKSVDQNPGFVSITNTVGQSRKMSKTSYKESADAVYSKALNLIGKEVQIQTSQNTSNWSESEWFSDIFEK